MRMPTVIRQTALLLTQQEISEAILNSVLPPLKTKDLKSPFVNVALRMRLRITMETQVLLVNLGEITLTNPFSIFNF